MDMVRELLKYDNMDVNDKTSVPPDAHFETSCQCSEVEPSLNTRNPSFEMLSILYLLVRELLYWHKIRGFDTSKQQSQASPRNILNLAARIAVIARR
jgi:hypothetical protein